MANVVKVMLRTYQQKKDGTYPVVIRVHSKGKTRFIFTGYSVVKDQFREVEGKWIQKHKHADVINAELRQKASELSGEPVNKKSLSKYLEYRAKEFKAAGRVDMDRKLRRQKAEIEQMTDREVFFWEIDMAWIRRYAVHNATKNGNANNTIMRKIKNLRTIYGQAITDKWAEYPNPFDAYKIHLDPVDRAKLTMEEIGKLEALTLDKGKVLDNARNAFIFAFYAHGMRFGSVFTLEWNMINDNVLRYQMDKGKKFREIVLHPKALAILEQYRGSERWVFPFCKRPWRDEEDFMNMKGSANALVNGALKIVAELAGIEKVISTHVARHSFAYLLKTKRVDGHIIQDALGHSSLGITESYLKSLDDDVINEAVNGAFN